jgi:hypothetical protein
MDDELEVFLSDLTPAAQKKVLAFLGKRLKSQTSMSFLCSFCQSPNALINEKGVWRLSNF